MDKLDALFCDIVKEPTIYSNIYKDKEMDVDKFTEVEKQIEERVGEILCEKYKTLLKEYSVTDIDSMVECFSTKPGSAVINGIMKAYEYIYGFRKRDDDKSAKDDKPEKEKSCKEYKRILKENNIHDGESMVKFLKNDPKSETRLSCIKAYTYVHVRNMCKDGSKKKSKKPKKKSKKSKRKRSVHKKKSRKKKYKN